jgi:hypothetical protein
LFLVSEARTNNEELSKSIASQPTDLLSVENSLFARFVARHVCAKARIYCNELVFYRLCQRLSSHPNGKLASARADCGSQGIHRRADVVALDCRQLQVTDSRDDVVANEAFVQFVSFGLAAPSYMIEPVFEIL